MFLCFSVIFLFKCLIHEMGSLDNKFTCLTFPFLFVIVQMEAWGDAKRNNTIQSTIACSLSCTVVIVNLTSCKWYFALFISWKMLREI